MQKGSSPGLHKNRNSQTRTEKHVALQSDFIGRCLDNVSERKPFRWFHGDVNTAGYGVGFVAVENTGAGEARGKCFTLPVNKHISCNFCSQIWSLPAMVGEADC